MMSRLGAIGRNESRLSGRRTGRDGLSAGAARPGARAGAQRRDTVPPGIPSDEVKSRIDT